ncbi:MAG: hypothetical protein LH609_20700 [Rudanella sp.]|nr:hypothetical protein [Rudanella sp.]
MKDNTELAALGRIIIAIKMYRHQTKDYQNLLSNKCVSIYLKTYLSIDDWALQQRVKDDREMFSRLNDEAYG